MDSTTIVKEIAINMPDAIRVFEKFGIDYCCGGNKSLADACAAAGANLQELIESIESSARPGVAADDQSWMTASLHDLQTHILDTHHVFTRQELERLDALFAKVCNRHGENHPELFKLQEVYVDLRNDLIPHMLKEEQVLFPYIESMESAMVAGQPAPRPFFGTVNHPVRMMMMEHDRVGDLLRQLREISSAYQPPADACMSYQALFQALAGLEADLHRHIHLENNILFPRAAEMEQSAQRPWAETKGEQEHRCFSPRE